TKEIFFVADGSGGHAFAENLQQHQQNVAKLRQFEQQLRTPAPADRAVPFAEPAPPIIDPAPQAVPTAATKNGKQKARAKALGRGTIHANLSVQRAGAAPVVRVNEPVLSAILSTMRDVAERIDAAPPTVDGILGLKGVIEIIDEDEREEDRHAGEAAVIAGF